jgi:hypothetical protein
VLEAVQAEDTLRSAVGAAPTIASAKFTHAVRPGALLQLRLSQRNARLHFEVREGERLAASGQFDLVAPTVRADVA